MREVAGVQHCLAALADKDVELRLTPSWWPYVDAVVAAGGEFSASGGQWRAGRP